MNKKMIVIITTLLIFGSLFLFYLNISKKENNKELTLYGNVDIRQVNLAFRVGGRVEKMFFDEGDSVKSGDILALLDNKPYVDELNLSIADLKASEANFLKFKNGNRKQEIESARATLNEREAAYKKAQILYCRQKNVVNNGAVSHQALDDSKLALDEAKARLYSSKEHLNLLEEGFRYEDILQAEAQVQQAKAKLDLTKTNLADTKIIAPNDGTILTRIQEPGAIVDVGSPIYTLSLKSPLWVRTYVSEVNLGKIFPDMKAKVYTDSKPDSPYEGHIGFISPVAEFTPKTVETTDLRTDLVYRLRVVVDNPDNMLKQGMPVTVKINLVNQNDK